MRIRDLQPGYHVTLAVDLGYEATVVGIVDPHPLYPRLVMVVWYHPVSNPISPGREFSFDALSPDMVLPSEQKVTTDGATDRIRAILQPGSTSNAH